MVGGHFRRNQAAVLTPARWHQAWHSDLAGDGPNTHGRAWSSMGLCSRQSDGNWDSYAGRFAAWGCVEVVLRRWLPFFELVRRWAAPPVHHRLQGRAPRLPRAPLKLLDRSIAPNGGGKTQIWWLPRVRRVLDLRPKIRTIGGAKYRGF
jgi:hypothetical protein